MALKEVNRADPKIAELNGILLNLDNGDLVAVDAAIAKLGFKNRESLLRYALAVIAQTESPIVYINKGGDDALSS